MWRRQRGTHLQWKWYVAVSDLHTDVADPVVSAQSIIWALCDGTGIDASELHDPDVLHLMWAGMAKYAVKDTCIVLKRLGGEAALNELIRRAQSLLRCVKIVWRLDFSAP